ncbi:MAG TPA: TetR/AcrR family transcriptional regulator [Microthrixaceae bacterium]|nr:TetR/AcrR family transcriptional regulator [Microthrixaceae bacterium]
MTADVPSADAAVEAGEATTSLRELAVARSLDPARVRAEKRVQRFLDAALELMSSTSGKEFTVQEVVEKSGQSLRSFYQYFAGKYELLLALFEESVRSTAEQLGELVADEAEPLERLRILATEYYRTCQPGAKPKQKGGGKVPASAMAEFAQQLLTEHPREASQAFVPMVSLFTDALDAAAEAGSVRPGLDHRRLAGVMLQSIMFNAFASTISGTSVHADAEGAAGELWELVMHGIATDRS